MTASPAGSGTRVGVDGKFLRVGATRFHVKGVAYGTFAPDGRGEQFPRRGRVEADFAAMARAGINTVRTYTPPPDEVLDCAAGHGLAVMAGLPWPQHTAFLDSARQQRAIRDSLARSIARLGRHPAVALAAVGNEIPAAVVRWHGPRRIERFLGQVYDDAKAIHPELLLTYVNFPPTEYLELPFFDVCAFNVYLHDRVALARYLARLQHVAGPQPLLLAEAGADSFREGLDGQASLTAMQLREAFAAGACGAVAFSWTDEWWRGGHPVEDWAFGLVTADRRAKPALTSVSRVFARGAEPTERAPRVSVVICAYNAAATIEDCLRSLSALRYPDFETIVVNDGSTDATSALAHRFSDVRVIDIDNGGLAAARNVGAMYARGEIVAYTDADTRVDPDWLTFLVRPFRQPGVVAAGGPNVVPPDDPFVAHCVARAPGGPTHVMLDDEIAEHVPGCNLAIRRGALVDIGGFNPAFLRAGDDVDVCWRLQAEGGRIAFAPAALVWHHHRTSLRAYWRQQVGYGEGEVWLRPFHPERFNGARPFWRGCIYGALPMLRSLSARRVNAGIWGTAAFPAIYRGSPHPLVHLPHSGGWQLLTTSLLTAAGVAALAGSGSISRTLAASGLAALALTLGNCVRYALGTDLTGLPRGGGSPVWARTRARALIALLHYVQPLARLHGQIRGLLSSAPEKRRATARDAGTPRLMAARLMGARGEQQQFWAESPLTAVMLLDRVVAELRSTRVSNLVEVDDGWWTERDVSVAVGAVARVDLRLLVEDHGAGRSLVRAATRIRLTAAGVLGSAAAVAAGLYGVLTPGYLLDALGVASVVGIAWGIEKAAGVGSVVHRTVQGIARAAGLLALGSRADERSDRPDRAMAGARHDPEAEEVCRR